MNQWFHEMAQKRHGIYWNPNAFYHSQEKNIIFLKEQMASLDIPIPQSTLAVGDLISKKLSKRTTWTSYPATQWDVNERTQKIYRKAIDTHKKYLKNKAITEVSCFLSAMSKRTAMSDTRLNDFFLGFLDYDEITRFKERLISIITSGIHVRNLNLSKDLPRQIITSHIKNAKTFERGITIISNIHPLHQRQLFKSRSHLAEILPLNDILHHLLKESVSLSDYINKFFLLHISGEIDIYQHTFAIMNLFRIRYLTSGTERANRFQIRRVVEGTTSPLRKSQNSAWIL
ncbi:MAG: hypothetical protein Hyperionvirus28_4 [Hyperionvirus sp.]|uniref:Uncharacterized protein n=1 Tax=Hyperionvirus sp. TaxID=2487770 RepID=A0A3G5ABB7_9VIRU|nr:MAG: hypothetical protein Hyperionvirus28_4 [Hyperionvirus sp.]